jgi:molybdopterin-containing oxidoreductase family molybdopterin binding subunit
MKMVVFDPMCNFAGGKASEWIPILPGTDGAVALAMCNVIVNELGIWDQVYLKTKTNGSYLIGADGKYIRDGKTGKPLVWDSAKSRATLYDDPSIGDYALDGTYEIKGVKCQPSFQVVKEHIKKYTPEIASKISTVPAETIRRIATEFAKAASVGSTINIEGKQLPFRPASATIFRGGEGHENSLHTCFAVCLLNHLLGSADVPGGTLGWPARSLGFHETGKLGWGVRKGADGFVTLDRWFIPHKPWPIHEPKFPSTATLQDFFTLCSFSPIWGAADQEEIYNKIKLPYRIELMINMGCNW